MASSRIGMMYRVSVKVCPNSKVLTPIPRVIVATCKIRKPEPVNIWMGAQARGESVIGHSGCGN